jgi:glutamine synthetase
MLLPSYTKLVDKFKVQTDLLAEVLDQSGGAAFAHATHMRDEIVPAMAKLRDTGDAIEELTPHGVWPLPTYREMLFVT